MSSLIDPMLKPPQQSRLQDLLQLQRVKLRRMTMAVSVAIYSGNVRVPCPIDHACTGYDLDFCRV